MARAVELEAKDKMAFIHTAAGPDSCEIALFESAAVLSGLLTPRCSRCSVQSPTIRIPGMGKPPPIGVGYL